MDQARPREPAMLGNELADKLKHLHFHRIKKYEFSTQLMGDIKMFNLKKVDNNDIDSLIESMLRLIDYMSSNPNIKRKIFESFTSEDLSKILKNLSEKSQTLRKASCLFLCIILQNEQNCQHFVQTMDLLPVNSKIALNAIPETLRKSVTAELLQKINTVQPMEGAICWYYTA